MKFSLTMECNNDAFHDSGLEGEVIRIMQRLSEQIMVGDADVHESYRLLDVNGNTVGVAKFEGKR